MNLGCTVNKKKRLQVQLRNIRENLSKPFLKQVTGDRGEEEPPFLKRKRPLEGWGVRREKKSTGE